jgi:acyl-CoA thioester hydrolase
MPRLEIEIDDVRMLPETYRATIPTSYLDDMGHMNVMWYTHLFSQAMGGAFELIGLQWKHLVADQFGTFALEAHLRYLAEVRVGQTVVIHSRAVSRSSRRFHWMHFMVNQDLGNVAATFENMGTFVDLRARRSAPIPAPISNRLDDLLVEHQQLPWAAPVCGIMSA